MANGDKPQAGTRRVTRAASSSELLLKASGYIPNQASVPATLDRMHDYVLTELRYIADHTAQTLEILGEQDSVLTGHVNDTTLHLPAGAESNTLRHNGTQYVSNDILRVTAAGRIGVNADPDTNFPAPATVKITGAAGTWTDVFLESTNAGRDVGGRLYFSNSNYEVANDQYHIRGAPDRGLEFLKQFVVRFKIHTDGRVSSGADQKGVSAAWTHINNGMELINTVGNISWIAFRGLAVSNISVHNRFYYNAGTTILGEIQTTSTATAYLTTSDRRLKRNLRAVTEALDDLVAIPVYKGQFVPPDGSTDDSDYHMFLADEVKPVLAGVVSGEADEIDRSGKPIYQLMDHSKMVPTLWAAAQAILARLVAAEETLAAHDAQIQELQARVTTLETEQGARDQLIADLLLRVQALEARDG